MNKKGKLTLTLIATLIIVLAVIVWYVFFSGQIRATILSTIVERLK